MAWLSALGVSGQASPVPQCSFVAETRVQIERQHLVDAEQILRSHTAEGGACPDAGYLLGYVLLRQNKPDASLKAYTEAAKGRPPTSADFTAIASDYILLTAYNDAERWLVHAVQTPPVNPQAWYLLGRTEYNLDRNAAAVKCFKRSLEVFPEDPRSEYNLGLAYERLQQPDLARAAYETAILWGERKHSRDAQPYLDLGMLLRSQGDAQRALPLLQSAASLSPTNPLVFQELGRTLAELKQTDDAIAALQKAITLAPNAEPPHFFLGRLFRAVGKSSEAEEQFAIVQQLLANGSSKSTPNTDNAPY